MSSNYDGKPAMDYWQAATHTIINEFREFICKTQLTKFHYLSKTARHFLIWMQINAIELETVDGTVIGRFLQHQCNCYGISSEPDRQCLWRPRDGCIQLLWFVRFLEQTGRIRTPGDLQDNVALVHDFVEQVRLQGYSADAIALYRAAALNLIIWLHFFRVRLCDLTPEDSHTTENGSSRALCRVCLYREAAGSRSSKNTPWAGFLTIWSGLVNSRRSSRSHPTIRNRPF